MASETLILEKYLPLRLSLLAHRLTRSVSAAYPREAHLSAAEWRILGSLEREGALTTGAVVERTGMDKVRVSRAVIRLLAAKHITERRDSGDRRRTIIEMTPAGTAAYLRMMPLMRAAETAAFADFSAEERAVFDRVIGKLEARVIGLLSDSEPEEMVAQAGE